MASRIRECFVPRPGRLLCSVDYGALELCTLAQVCLWMLGESKMAEAINAGRDLHLLLASRIAGITYEEALVKKKARDPFILGLRQACKPIVFGVGGLMGGPRLASTARKQGVRFCELSKRLDTCGSDGKAHEYKGRQISPTCAVCLELSCYYRDLYFEIYPEVIEYHRQMMAIAESGEPIKSLSRGGMLRLESGAGAACNHPFQNLAATGAKDATWELAKACYVGPCVLTGNAVPVLMVHDELILEVKEECVSECAKEQSRIMVETMRRHVPDVKITAEPALMRRWYKGAEAVYSNGKLVPWEPA